MTNHNTAMMALAASWEDACNRADDRGVFTKRAIRECAAQLRALAAPSQVVDDDDAIMQALRDAGLRSHPDLIRTVWKDGIDLDFPSHALLQFVAAIRNTASQEPQS